MVLDDVLGEEERCGRGFHYTRRQVLSGWDITHGLYFVATFDFWWFHSS